MSQYPYLFCSTRLPQHGTDRLASFPGHSHVVVMRNGHFYSIPAAKSDGGCGCVCALVCSVVSGAQVFQ
jgi:hypothetical protein